MDIVVKGRNVDVPVHYRAHVGDKLRKVERYDHKIIRVDVELFHERNPRQSDNCQRVEITCMSRGPVVRAEACAADFYSALDAAIAKLDTRLRRAADRRRIHRGRHAPISVAEATASLAEWTVPAQPQHPASLVTVAERDTTAGRDNIHIHPDRSSEDHRHHHHNGHHNGQTRYDGDNDVDDQPWHIVWMAEHPAAPMTVDDALSRMELVGHDVYMFLDKDSGRASVVYRRHAYDYGVLSLADAA